MKWLRSSVVPTAAQHLVLRRRQGILPFLVGLADRELLVVLRHSSGSVSSDARQHAAVSSEMQVWVDYSHPPTTQDRRIIGLPVRRLGLSAGGTMTRQEIIAFFDERQKHWSVRDSARLAAAHAEDGVVISPMWRERVGRQAIADSYESLFETFPDWDFHGQALIIDGDRVAQPFAVTATHEGEFMGFPGTHRRCQIQGVRLYEMGDGCIKHERRMYDFTSLLIQVGVLRSKPSY
jgi:steroid delta-isomerase-like uncharacterized protein